MVRHFSDTIISCIMPTVFQSITYVSNTNSFYTISSYPYFFVAIHLYNLSFSPFTLSFEHQFCITATYRNWKSTFSLIVFDSTNLSSSTYHKKQTMT